VKPARQGLVCNTAMNLQSHASLPRRPAAVKCVCRLGKHCIAAADPLVSSSPRAEPAGRHSEPRAQAVRLWQRQGAGARRAQHQLHLLAVRNWTPTIRLREQLSRCQERTQGAGCSRCGSLLLRPLRRRVDAAMDAEGRFEPCPRAWTAPAPAVRATRDALNPKP